MADNSDSEEKRFSHQNQHYDEALDVPDAEEVASIYTPTPRVQKRFGGPGPGQASRGNTPPKANMSDNSEDEFDTGQPEKDYNHANAARSVRPPAADNFDESSEEEEDDDDEDNADIRGPMEQAPPPQKRPGPSAVGPVGGNQMYNEDDDDDEETGSSEEDDDDDEGSGGAVEGAYDPADYEHLPVTPEIKELFQYITRYTTQTIELEHKLKPFIPDFIPAVGDIDAFLKIQRPDGKPDTLGLTVLDEPCARQSDPTVLDLQLRAVSKQTNLKAVVVKSIEDAEKNPKAVDNWIQSISEIHRSRPPPNVHYTKNMPDIDSLMQEWPADFEELLKEVSLPSADIDCDLATYVDMICAVLDIPIYKSKIQSLHVLFTLYSEFKNSQHFRSLAAENKMDNTLKNPDIGNADTLVI